MKCIVNMVQVIIIVVMDIWEDIASAVNANYSFISGLIRIRVLALRLDSWNNLVVCLWPGNTTRQEFMVK